MPQILMDDKYTTTHVWPGSVKQQAITWVDVDQVPWRYTVLLEAMS